MNLDTNQVLQKLKQISINKIILNFSITYFLVNFVWQSLFLRGWVRGIYWLFIITENISVFLPSLFFVLGGITLIISITLWLFKKTSNKSVLKTSGTLIVSGLVSSFFLISLFSYYIFKSELRHIDTLSIRNKVYYLNAYSGFETDYGLYECDSFGFICKTIFFYPGYRPDWFYAGLSYDGTTREIIINVKDKGEIYRYKTP